MWILWRHLLYNCKILMSGLDFDTRYGILFYFYPDVLLSFGDNWLYFSINVM